MDNFNRILSFIIGLVVIVVIVAIIANRINVGKRVSNLAASVKKTGAGTPTMFPTVTPVYSPMPTAPQKPIVADSRYVTPVKPGKPVTNIPSTGAPTLLLPLSMAGMFVGVYLKKKA